MGFGSSKDDPPKPEEVSAQPRLCKDCKHRGKVMIEEHPHEYTLCNREFIISPVTGKPLIKIHFCSVQREHVNLCGPGARYFEPKV